MSTLILPEIQNVTCDKYNNRASSGSGCTIQGSNDWWYRTFLKYDLSNMPQDIEIISAKLYMYCYRWNDNASSGTTNISRITSDWTEESVTNWYSTQPSTTGTYLSSNVSPPAVGNWTEWDITSLVQEWYTGAYPNYGLYIKNNNEGSYRVDWNVYSRKQGNGEYATYIEVEYTGGEPILPDEYQQVEYIESTGTQYIDTGIKVDNTYGYKCKFQALNTDDSIIVGVCGTGDSRWCLNSSTTLNPSWNAIYSFSNTDTNAHTVQYNYLNDRKRYIDNVEGIAITSTLQSAASNYDVLIFAAHWRSTSVSLYSSAKLFSLEITKDTELIRNFIPCYRKSDNVIGLYDLVNDVFYTNAGSGVFTKGPNVGPEPPTPPTPWRELYQAVEWIESTGTQWINTNFKPNQDTRIVVEAQQTASNNYPRVFASGAYNTSGAVTFDFEGGAAYVKWGHTGMLSVSFSDYSSRNIFDLNKNVFYINNTQKQSTTYTTFQSSGPLGICAYSGASGTEFFKGKIYSVQIYDNGVLARNLIPAYRKADNVAGMYDLENDTFYINVGSGIFNVGPLVRYNKYLIRDGNKLYKFDDQSITELVGATLNAELFQSDGYDSPPVGTLLLDDSLSVPEILAWEPDAAPQVHAIVSATPQLPQEIIAPVDATDSTIVGVDSVVCTYVGTPKFAISQDEGETWLEYRNSSWTAFVSGNTPTEFQSADWDWVPGESFLVKMIINDTLSTITSIIFNYENEE